MSAVETPLPVLAEVTPVREEIPLATQPQPWWRQTRGKAMLIGGAVIAIAIFALLLSQLPGQVQTLATPQPTTVPQPTATKAAVALAPTQPPTSVPASASEPLVMPAPTKSCRVLNVDQQEGFLFVQDCDGSNWRKLTDPPVWVQWPSWSPDGQRIVFEYNPSKPRPGPNPTSLYIVNADGSGQRH